MSTELNGSWWHSLPSCETSVPCGSGWHTIRWEAGALQLPSHPDAEGEQVLAALGGTRARCIELADAWARHTSDLSVLAIGPRGPADEITVGWDDVITAAQAGLGAGPAAAYGRPGPLTGSGPVRQAMARVTARQRQLQDEMRAAQRHRDDLLALLALGYDFQVRLAGQITAAHAGPEPARPGAGSGSALGAGPGSAEGTGPGSAEGTGPGSAERAGPGSAEGTGPARDAGTGPALVAAIAGRLAPVAERWLGIDPDQVMVRLHQGPGWGSAELTGREAGRRLRVALPAGWLASVWACGLALTGRHLVVAVQQPGWPRARVLGLRAPGAEPEPLEVVAGAEGAWYVSH